LAARILDSSPANYNCPKLLTLTNYLLRPWANHLLNAALNTS